MKIENLMIGDWVMYNPNTFIEDEYVPTKKCFPLQIQSGEDIDLACECCYEPIPLTTEILLANGFERNERFDHDECIYFSFPTKRNGFGIEKRYDMYYITYHELMPIRYVHEFQQALRLCKLTDIANNFKIN